MTFRLIPIAILLMTFKSLQAQTQISGMGGPALKAGKTGNSTEIYIGGLGAMTINNFYVGGGGFSLVGEALQGAEEITFGYGGILLGYQRNLNSRLGFYAHSLLASGGGNIGESESYSAFVAEPELGISLTITPFLQIKPGLSYRILAYHESSSIEPALGGGFFNLGFAFGYFN